MCDSGSPRELGVPLPVPVSVPVMPLLSAAFDLGVATPVAEPIGLPAAPGCCCAMGLRTLQFCDVGDMGSCPGCGGFTQDEEREGACARGFASASAKSANSSGT